MKHITSAEWEQVISRSVRPVVVEFWTEWCSPCRIFDRILANLEKLFGERVDFAKVNVDKEPRIAAKYQIMSIPALLVFVNGEDKYRFVGVKPFAELAKLLETLASP